MMGLIAGLLVGLVVGGVLGLVLRGSIDLGDAFWSWVLARRRRQLRRRRQRLFWRD